MCRYSIEDLIKNKNTDAGNILNNLTPGKIFYQATLGLEHLHDIGYTHGNIHQRNVLVAEINNGSTSHYVVKLSDFQFVKRLQTKGKWMLTQSSNSEIKGDQQRKDEIERISADVKSLGDVFDYVLNGTDKEESTAISNEGSEQKNIKTKYRKLIDCMTSSKAYDRPSVSQILAYLEKNGCDDKFCCSRPGLCIIILQENAVRILVTALFKRFNDMHIISYFKCHAIFKN